jgi:truncated hemoglobin YjbI
MSTPLTKELILSITQSFYDKVKTDILIGYHFRNIEDFDEHIPNIARFWQMQLLGELIPGKPFDLMNKHLALQMSIGQLDRWIKIFVDNLSEYDLKQEDIDTWCGKVTWFRQRFLMIPSMVRA